MGNKVFHYLVNHWRGDLSLAISFWGNFIALFFLLVIVEPLLLSKFATNPAQLIRTALVSLFITRLLIFPWQVIGLIRSVEKHFLRHRDYLIFRGTQAVVVFSVLYTLFYIIYTMQTVFIFKREVETFVPDSTQKHYSLNLKNAGKQLEIIGILDIGITDTVRTFLIKNKGVSSVLLESPGGQIYEGRGLAKLILKEQLDTYTNQECSSACVTAFIAGKRRYLGRNGKLGFHQYRIESRDIGQIISFYDLISEQRKDLDYFQAREIDQPFLDKIFDQPATKMWFPEQSELLEAGVVHVITPSTLENKM